MRTTLDEERTCFYRIPSAETSDKLQLKLKHRAAALGPKQGQQEQPTRRKAPQDITCIQVERLGCEQQEAPISGQQQDRQKPEAGPDRGQFGSCCARSQADPEAAAGPTAEMGSVQQATKRIQEQQQQRHDAQSSCGQTVPRPISTNQQQQQTATSNCLIAGRPHASHPPKSYPNNTLVEDLSRCHDNLWPKAARATRKTLKIIKLCSPKSKVSAKKATNEPGKPGSESQEPTLESKKLKFGQAKRKYKFPIPDTISRLNSTLSHEDYNRALCVLTNDIRFQLHIILFGRLQTIWTLFSTILCILIPIIFRAATPETFVIFGSCAIWLALQATGLIVTGQCRKKLDRMLERAVAQANSYFLDHKLMLGVINVGGLLTKSRLVIPMVYFDTFECIEQIESIISVDLKATDADGKSDKETRQKKRSRSLACDYPRFGPHQASSNQKAFAQSQLAKKIVLRCSQRWISHFDKRRLMFTDDKLKPRHLSTGKCLCQFIEEHLKRNQQFEDLVRLECADGTRPQQAEGIEQLQVSKLESQPIGRMARNQTIGALRGQTTIVNIPNQTNDFKKPDEQQLDETPFKPGTVVHTLSGACSLNHRDLTVTTLSHLVSLRAHQDEHSARRPKTTDSADSTASSNYSSRLVDGFALHVQRERADLSSSPTTELSLDLDGDSLMNRNDELIRRLKVMLEIRSNEFSKGLDGGLISSSVTSKHNDYHPPGGARDKASQSNERANGSVMSNGNSIGYQTIHQEDEANTNSNNNNNNHHGSPISQIGKKFFSQTDGLFFLGSKKGHQPGVYARQQQQLLEIC